MITATSLPKTMFIVFEGPDGSGKTTQLNMFVEALRAKFPERRIITTRLPGGTPFGEEIRNLTKHFTGRISVHAELLAMCAGYAQVIDSIVAPAKDTETIVVCDRFYMSGLAYQLLGKMVPMTDWLCQMSDVAATVIPVINASLARFNEDRSAYTYYFPHLTFCFDTPFDELQARKKNRLQLMLDRFEGNDDYDKRVMHAYRTLMPLMHMINQKDTHSCMCHIDGDGTKEEVFDRLIKQFNTAMQTPCPDYPTHRNVTSSQEAPNYEALTQ